MNLQFRKAEVVDSSVIWSILQDAIQRRKEDGSNQWQDGYPNETIIAQDISNNRGFVLTNGKYIIGYVALWKNNEPSYDSIDGNWITNEDFVVFHRMAIATDFAGKGYGQKLFKEIEHHAIQIGVPSIKADTNFDNYAMLSLFRKMGYRYCGEVIVGGGIRKAFEKNITH